MCGGGGTDQEERAPERGGVRGAPGRTRTCGQALRRRLLYPLSYGGRSRSRRGDNAPGDQARPRIGAPEADAACFTSATPCGGSVKRPRYSQAGVICAADSTSCGAGVVQSLWLWAPEVWSSYGFAGANGVIRRDSRGFPCAELRRRFKKPANLGILPRWRSWTYGLNYSTR